MNIKNFFEPFSSGPVKLIAVVQFVFLMLVWMVAPNSLFPSPVEVFKTWNTLAKEQSLLVELSASAWTILQALFYSSIIGTTVAYLAAVNIFKPISNGIAALRFLGFAGITFMFTMMTSDGASLKVAMLTFGMVVFQVTNMMSVTNSITQSEVDYAHTLRLGPVRTVYELLIRGRAHDFLDIIRQNAAIGWVMLSMVEGLVRSDGGIGSLLISQSKYLNLSAILAIQLTILFYGIFQDYILGLIRLMLCPYLKYSNVKG